MESALGVLILGCIEESLHPSNNTTIRTIGVYMNGTISNRFGRRGFSDRGHRPGTRSSAPYFPMS